MWFGGLPTFKMFPESHILCVPFYVNYVSMWFRPGKKYADFIPAFSEMTKNEVLIHAKRL